MRMPETVAGRVWFQAYFQKLGQFFTSGRRDTDALEEAARSLSFLLQREPAYAREARQLALQCSIGAYNSGRSDAIAALVQVGLDAEVMSPDLGNEPTPTLLLMLYEAEAERIDGRRLDGLATLERMAQRLGTGQPEDPLFQLLLARSAFVRAELEELDREFERARDLFEESRAAMASLIGDEAGKQALIGDWLLQAFGPKDSSLDGQIDGLVGVFSLLLTQTYVGALLGCLRSARDSDDVRLEAVAGELEAAVAAHGLVYGASPFLLSAAVGRLKPERAAQLGAALSNASASAQSRVLQDGLLGGLDPKLVEVLHAVSKQSEEQAAREALAWRVAMLIAEARSLESAGDAQTAMTVYHRAVKAALESHTGLTNTFAIGALVSFMGRESRLSEGVLEMFLLALGGTIDADPELFEDLRFRALLDEPTLYATSWLLMQPGTLASRADRLRLSVLLDLLRRRKPPSSRVVLGLARDEDPRGGLSEPGLIANTLDRITDAISTRVGALVLIAHSDGQDTFFLSVDQGGPALWSAGLGFDDAIEALEVAAQRVLISGPAMTGEDFVVVAAQRAFQAFPEELRARIVAAESVYVVPSFHRDADVIPYELLHDGKSYLMQSLIIARFTSLEHLARILDTRSWQPRRRRALVTAAPDGDPLRPLYTALSERDSIRISLEDDGFDAPKIEPDRLNASFYCDRLPYIDTLHVAAHGESMAGTEYVVLGGGRRLSVDDIDAARPALVPFAYLNTCQLARTRYLGGGQAKGIAYALCEHGAPALLANTADVLDEVSTALATGFYDQASDHGAGAALREMRRRVIAMGYHPTLVGRVVLFGDPDYRVSSDQQKVQNFDLASSLLDGYFVPAAKESAAQSRLEAERAMQAGNPSARLRAAVELLFTLQRFEDSIGDDRMALLSEAITLADGLGHRPTQAAIRYLRARSAIESGNSAVRRYLRDAIDHLKSLEPFDDQWARQHLELLGELRTLDLGREGIGFRRMGPQSDEDDASVNAIGRLIMGHHQAQEERIGKVRLRPREDKLEDIAWNAIVIGHPNRFEDPADAVAFARFLTAKLIARGHLTAVSNPYSTTMLVGLLWYLWSNQKLPYLEPELVQVQTSALIALIDDIWNHWAPLDDDQAKRDLDAFKARVEDCLASLDDQSWEEVTTSMKERIPELALEAKQLLDRLTRSSPFSLAGASAYVAGVLAEKNVYSALDGSVPEQKQALLTDALWAISNANDSRFRPYLWAGLEPLRKREPDELARWRTEARS